MLISLVGEDIIAEMLLPAIAKELRKKELDKYGK